MAILSSIPTGCDGRAAGYALGKSQINATELEALDPALAQIGKLVAPARPTGHIRCSSRSARRNTWPNCRRSTSRACSPTTPSSSPPRLTISSGEVRHFCARRWDCRHVRDRWDAGGAVCCARDQHLAVGADRRRQADRQSRIRRAAGPVAYRRDQHAGRRASARDAIRTFALYVPRELVRRIVASGQAAAGSATARR